MFENIKNAEDLKAAILTINVKDFGDFKRKAVLYLNRYREEHKLNGEQNALIAAIINKLQFEPPGEIERLRSWSLDQLTRLH